MVPVTFPYQHGDDPAVARLYYGQDCRDSLRQLADQSVHMVATSPPYWCLRDYGNAPSVWGGNPECDHEWGTLVPQDSRHRYTVANSTKEGVVTESGGYPTIRGAFCQKCGAWQGPLGMEPTPELFVSHLVEVFREVHRVLRDDGTLWVNLGDSYNAAGREGHGTRIGTKQGTNRASAEGADVVRPSADGIKPKDLVGIPWMVAFALRADGWYLRSDIIWAKPNPMPESVRDRPTKAHEYIFLLTKNERYFYDADAIAEPTKEVITATKLSGAYSEGSGRNDGGLHYTGGFVTGDMRNKRTVWNVNPKPYQGAHFAVWPEKLVAPMILAGSSQHGCCSQCRAPWTRVVETSGGRDWRQDKMVVKGIPGELAGEGSYKRGQSHTPLNDNKQREHKGWQPTCTCDAAVVPCTVLDVFSGSATTGLVAMSQGRNYIGLDASKDYLDLAKARVQGHAAPAKVDETTAEAAASFLDLFGR